ncbi:DsbA family protein [Halocatena pleomorpha]|uniref:Disulfide bond formation protein DsbA n=1 Tax=Halocatena pleomorpha TaxID=1785090 RepID=A0A3P3R7Y7_9EURY|nr:thioredoxin domain-containing protein [Halocatena pleomorpha]RRJ29557.1 disulfide bond formation protein DsbA [Halocatena pleomorpha]
MPTDESSCSRRNVMQGATLILGTSIAGCLNQLGTGTDDNQSSTLTQTRTTSNVSKNNGPTQSTSYEVTVSQDSPTPASTPASTPTPTKEISSSLVALAGTTEYGIKLAGTPVLGKEDAPIDIYYWYDYQCAYCKQFEKKYLPDLVQNEINNGTARMILLQYPNYGEHSWTAAVMAKCLWESVKDRAPDVFWKWHHSVFEHQRLPEEKWSSKDSLLGYAQSITGINEDSINECIKQNRKKFESDIRNERKRSQEEGFSATPGFTLYVRKTGKQVKLTGAQPYSWFQSHIQSLQNQ